MCVHFSCDRNSTEKRGLSKGSNFSSFHLYFMGRSRNFFILKILLIDFLKLFLSEISLKWIIKITKNKVQAIKVKLNTIYFCQIKIRAKNKKKCEIFFTTSLDRFSGAIVISYLSTIGNHHWGGDPVPVCVKPPFDS